LRLGLDPMVEELVLKSPAVVLKSLAVVVKPLCIYR
jgi:hypothetical protein